MIIIQKVFSIFVQNLAYYNEGSIEGGWLDLPQSSKVIDDYLKNVVKVDNTHEEYEIADVENPTPFPYASIQWSTVENLNKLAIIFNKLSEYQREAVKAHLIYCGEEHYAISELINMDVYNDNKYVGKITEYRSDNGNNMLRVNNKLIPYNKDFITKIDKENKSIYFHDIGVFL